MLKGFSELEIGGLAAIFLMGAVVYSQTGPATPSQSTSAVDVLSSMSDSDIRVYAALGYTKKRDAFMAFYGEGYFTRNYGRLYDACLRGDMGECRYFARAYLNGN